MTSCIVFTISGCGNANRGVSEKFFEEGMYYKLGEKGYPQDHKKATELFQKAADLGHPVAQYEIGVAYDTDGMSGYAEDHSEAFKWYLKAAKQEYSAPPQHPFSYMPPAAVGICYLNRKGVSQDIVEGCAWIIVADKKGWAPGFLEKQKKKMTAEQIAAAEKRASELE